jgi:endonuclease/exonuclease/phosphatase family metal-dependent hydrolase
MRRRLASLIVLVVTPCLALSCATARRGDADTGRELRVLIYNIHAGKDAAGVDNLERVAALVREVDADVVLLQEVDRGTTRSAGVDQPAQLARLGGRHAVFGRTLDYQGGEYGIAVLSRWPVSEHAVAPLRVEPPQARSGGSYEPRGALRVAITAPWGAMQVVNTHLDASREDQWRAQEVRGVLAVADSMRARGGLLLVGGDFNSEPSSAVQAELRRGGLRDAWAECGRGDSLTYPANRPVKRIDYLYLTGATRCVEARVLATEASDHRPLFVRVVR